MQKAAAIDPQDRASLPGPEGEAAREARLEGAYNFLVDPGRADPSLQNVALSPAERQVYLQQFLQVRLQVEPHHLLRAAMAMCGCLSTSSTCYLRPFWLEHNAARVEAVGLCKRSSRQK
jgi:hypothetical protein